MTAVLAPVLAAQVETLRRAAALSPLWRQAFTDVADAVESSTDLPFGSVEAMRWSRPMFSLVEVAERVLAGAA